MGIRPQMFLIVGIDDATSNDPRRDKSFDNPDYEVKEPILFEDDIDSYWYKTNKIYDISDILYNGYNDDEYVVGNVVGMILHKTEYDSDFIRAWATVNEEFRHKGYKVIPTLNPEEHPMLYKHYDYNEDDVKCNRFVDSIFENMPSISRKEWKRARHYLAQAGWNIPEEDLKYIIVWDWS